MSGTTPLDEAKILIVSDSVKLKSQMLTLHPDSIIPPEILFHPAYLICKFPDETLMVKMVSPEKYFEKTKDYFIGIRPFLEPVMNQYESDWNSQTDDFKKNHILVMYFYDYPEQLYIPKEELFEMV